ncbi:MAG: MerR family transcriptional regulator [Verrucomicrobia bacterium]|nr:MerR family transcriptional regulator [Verrucomicrobiota bacterium]MBV8482117.1 MerR family transcriptional regulator [Verrucomicrobiota bacterium]
MRIGQLATSVGVNVETIRYYQRIGLLQLPQKPYGGVRSYNEDDLRRLHFIRRAQHLGFSLDDIRTLLQLSGSDCQQVQKLAAEKLKLVRGKLTQLRKIESALSKTIQQCARREAPEPCPIIETLAERPDSV